MFSLFILITQFQFLYFYIFIFLGFFLGETFCKHRAVHRIQFAFLSLARNLCQETTPTPPINFAMNFDSFAEEKKLRFSRERKRRRERKKNCAIKIKNNKEKRNRGENHS